ncbi:MAG: hypothetical protein VB855_17065, partial [Pirellulaceae bacterium]
VGVGMTAGAAGIQCSNSENIADLFTEFGLLNIDESTGMLIFIFPVMPLRALYESRFLRLPMTLHTTGGTHKAVIQRSFLREQHLWRQDQGQPGQGYQNAHLSSPALHSASSGNRGSPPEPV